MSLPNCVQAVVAGGVDVGTVAEAVDAPHVPTPAWSAGGKFGCACFA